MSQRLGPGLDPSFDQRPESVRLSVRDPNEESEGVRFESLPSVHREFIARYEHTGLDQLVAIDAHEDSQRMMELVLSHA